VSHPLARDLLELARIQTRGMTLAEALNMKPPRPSAVRALRLRDIILSPEGADWTRWALSKPRAYWPAAFELALRLVASAHFPDLADVGEERRAA
jgi:hypothetical protein